MPDLDGVSVARGGGRSACLARRGAAALAAATLAVAAMAGTARAQTVIANWPHSPVNHLLRDPAPAASPSFTANLRGNFVTASNTLLTCPGNPLTRRQRATRRRQGRAVEPCEGRNNNDENMRYVNVDGAPRFDSSRATLTLPDGARVVRAYLYWGADLARGVSDSNTASYGAPGGETPVDPANPAAGGTNTLWTTALMRVGGGGYTTVDATAPGRQGAWQGIGSWYSSVGNKPGFAYQVRANVTAEITDAVTPRASGAGVLAAPEDAQRHGRRRAGRARQQPPRRLDAAGGVGDRDRRVAQPHAVRRVRVRAGAGQRAEGCRSAGLQRF